MDFRDLLNLLSIGLLGIGGGLIFLCISVVVLFMIGMFESRMEGGSMMDHEGQEWEPRFTPGDVVRMHDSDMLMDVCGYSPCTGLVACSWQQSLPDGGSTILEEVLPATSLVLVREAITER